MAGSENNADLKSEVESTGETVSRPTLLLFLGACSIAVAPLIVKLVSTGPTVSAFYRCAIAACLLYAIAWRRHPPSESRPRQGAALAIFLAAFFFALDLFVWHRSVLYVGAGVGTILANTQIFYVSIGGILFLGERLTLRLVLSVAIGFLGILLLVRPPAGIGLPSHYWTGIFLGLLTGVFYSGYLFSLREAQRRYPQPLWVQGHVSALCAAMLFGLSIMEGASLGPTWRDAAYLFLLALVAQVTGGLLITWTLPLVPVSHAGLILLAQPILATLWGALLFQEALSPLQWAGVCLTLAAIYLGGIRDGIKASAAITDTAKGTAL